MNDCANSVSLLTAALWIGGGAVVAAFAAGHAARFVKTSEHRQNWINALRDDVATYIVRANKIHIDTQNLLSRSSDMTEYGEIQPCVDNNMDDAETLFNKIVLRLNPDESDHIELHELLSKLRDTTQPDIALENRAIEQARRVLKREWDVAKYGELVNVQLCLKSYWRKILATVKKC